MDLRERTVFTECRPNEIEGLQAGVYGANLHDTLVSPILTPSDRFSQRLNILLLTLPGL
jgi:hypothetical protein